MLFTSAPVQNEKTILSVHGHTKVMYYHQYYMITGDEVCREKILGSHNVTKSFVPNLTANKSDTVKDDQEFPDEENSPKVIISMWW